jgi:hypothetical protein
MIVFKNDIATTFQVAYKSSFSPSTNIDDVMLTFARINADTTEYTFPAEILSYDCYNRLMEIQSTVSLDTGEYKVSLGTVGAYSLDYSNDYSKIDDVLLVIAVDNANIKRENAITKDSRGVAYIE